MLSSDSVASSDLLGRDIFAARIIKGLTKFFAGTNESLVVGISGKWGTGKSTLLSFLSKHLDEHYRLDQSKYRIVNFNSWGNTGDQDLERSFLEAVLKNLVEVDWKRSANDANEKFKSYLKYLEHLKFLRHFSGVANVAVGAMEDYLSLKAVRSLEDIKGHANEVLSKNNLKLYVLIDDLDRLTPSEITSLFKVLKVNLNLLNTFFVIAYDKEVVVNALKQQYAIDGSKYLEKIIQVDFEVPPVMEYQIEEMFFERLENFFETMDLAVDTTQLYSIWKYHGLKEYFHNVRDINRFFNSLIFSLPNVYQEVNIVEFVVLEAVKVFDYEVYENLLPEVLRVRRMAIWESIEFDDSQIARYKNLTTKALLKYLFTSPSSTASTLEKRLRDPEFFERYFSLSLSSLDIETENVSQFFLKNRNRTALLNSIYKNGKSKSFLRRLSDQKLNDHYTLDDELIFNNFLDFWEDESKLNAEISTYLYKSYFNLAYNFIDKRKGARIAISELILSGGSRLQTTRFLFNYFIRLRDIGIVSDFHPGPELREQLKVFKPEMEKYFLDYLKNNHDQYIWRIISEREEWFCNVFLFAFAKFLPDEYITVWKSDRLKNAKVLAYILKKNFVMYEAGTETPGMIKYDLKDTFFPGNLYDEMLEKLKGIMPGELDGKTSAVVELSLKEHQNK